ncbi:glycosyl-4,4'-diaponeurosporenoate acyltransferase CrtO family protein [Mucilaginibacter pedocola]|uniref:Glycosyl-4,4'-diaponeurosporenoate acyltransferase n=1 Tax=Mucilaginibacter pedocola TaxID=1792845 RepID=A0A1S9PB26_9SPHI|nr:hypothetical protein [Mucilaginibacter pedocola]OOQ58183.1 hypothetical protein BC343_11080 [Mucilaginibacter pedocola]
MNQAVNFFWTILCFIPVIGFWFAEGLTTWFYIFCSISIISLLIPARLLQLSNSPKFYEKLGVRVIRKFVQNGDLVKRISKNTRQQLRVIKGRESAIGYSSTIVMYERYHFLCFVFFLLTTAFALFIGKIPIAIIILVANVIYNICPILLQQYNRARLTRLSKVKAALKA